MRIILEGACSVKRKLALRPAHPIEGAGPVRRAWCVAPDSIGRFFEADLIFGAARKTPLDAGILNPQIRADIGSRSEEVAVIVRESGVWAAREIVRLRNFAILLVEAILGHLGAARIQSERAFVAIEKLGMLLFDSQLFERSDFVSLFAPFGDLEVRDGVRGGPLPASRRRRPNCRQEHGLP